MILDRNCVNKNITFSDINCHTSERVDYKYDDFSRLVDAWKNFFDSKNFNPGQSIFIAIEPGIFEFAGIFACFEYGLKLTISTPAKPFRGLGTYLDAKGPFNEELFDSRFKVLFPIDIWITSKTFYDGSSQLSWDDYKTNQEIENYLAKVTPNYLEITREEIEKFSGIQNLKIGATDKTVITRSVSSGTTNTPKVIEHTHEYAYEVVKRNAEWLTGESLGSYLHLNHGSQFFSYSIPSAVSSKTKNLYFYESRSLDSPEDIIFTLFVTKPDNVIFPYSYMVTDLLKLSIKYPIPFTTMHVAGTYIKNEWVEYVKKDNTVKDVVSNFGTSETLGPIFTNKASSEIFNEKSYEFVDDGFYQIRMGNEGLEILPKGFDDWFCSNDKFDIVDGKYFHNGRYDIIRINDFVVDSELYNKIAQTYANSTIVFDQVKDEIYWAVWETIDIKTLDKNAKKLGFDLSAQSYGTHRIQKYAILNQKEYLAGIKINHEEVRNFFRDNRYTTNNKWRFFGITDED